MTGQNSMNNKRNRTGSTSLNIKKQRNSGQSSVTNKVNKSGTRARWTPEFKCLFLEILLFWCNGGTNNKAYIPSRIDDSTWENITNDLKARCPSLIFEKKHLKQLHRDLKKKWSDSSKNRIPVACQIHPNCSCVQTHSNLCTDPSNRLNCLLHEVYGARGASENHQGPSSSADHSSSDNSLTDNQHGGESVSFGNHQLPGSSSALPSLQPQSTYMEEENNGALSGFLISDILNIPSDFINGNEQFQNQNANNTNPSYETLATNIPLQDQPYIEPIPLQNQANFSGHVSNNIAGTSSAVLNLSGSSIPSLWKCISEVDRLLQTNELLQPDERSEWDEWDAGEIFKDEHHRELFCSMDEIQRINWFRHKIIERRKQRWEERETA